MKVRITIGSALVADLRTRLRENLGSVLEVPAGLRRHATGIEFLAPIAAATADNPAAILRIALLPPALEGVSHHWWEGFPVPVSARPRADIALYEGRGCSAAALLGGAVLAVDEVVLAGPRMERWQPAIVPPDLVGTVPADGPFSRYMGALGGAAPHHRFRAIRAAGVGMARLNSLVAVALARAGVGKLALIDPDVLEEHSLDAVEVLADGAVGAPKVRGVARLLRAIAPQVEVEEFAVAADDPAAVRACAAADLIFSAPDQNQARLVATLLATAHHRVHLDLGSGVFGRDERFVAGTDVRLIVPGDGCLMCVGGLDLQRRQERDWRRQRAGSLRSLNSMAASLGMFQFERFLVGDVTASTWMQVVLDRHGSLTCRRMPRERDPGCVVCAEAGSGDRVFEMHRPETEPLRGGAL